MAFGKHASLAANKHHSQEDRQANKTHSKEGRQANMPLQMGPLSRQGQYQIGCTENKEP